MSNILGSLKVLLGLDATEYIQGFTKADKASRDFAERQKRNARAIDAQVASLQQQAAVYGMSARQAKLYDLAQRGANDAQLKAASAALRAVESQQAIARVASATGATVGIAAGVATTALIAMGHRIVEAGDQMAKLSQKSGIAVESLSVLRYAGALSDVSMEDLSTSTAKLAKSMSDAARGTGEGKAAFDAMGIAVKNADGSLRPTEAVLADIAEKFSGYEDGAGKAALATAIFGRAGADLIPLLNLGRVGLEQTRQEAERLGIVMSGEAAASAERFNDNLTRLGFAAEGLAQRALGPLIERLAKLSDDFLSSARSSGIAAATWQEALRVFSGQATREFVFGTQAEQEQAKLHDAVDKAAQDVRTLEAELEKLGEGSPAGSIVAVQLQAAQQRLAGLVTPGDDAARELARFQRQAGANAAAKGKAPALTGVGGDSPETLLKKQLDGQLKLIRDFAQEQRDGYDFANRYVQEAYDQGLVSLRETLDARARLRDASTAAAVAALDKEIAALESAKRKLSGADRIEKENQIKEAVAKRAATIQKASQDNILANQQETAALDQLKQRYDQFKSQLAELRGDTKGAATIKIDAQVKDAENLTAAAKGDPALVGEYRTRLEQTEALKQAQSDYNRLLERTRDREEEILIAAKQSGQSENETSAQVGAARQQALAQMAEMVAKAQELAAALGTDDAVRFAEQLALSFKRAASEANPLLEKVRDLGKEAGQAIADGFGEAIVQGKSLREVLNAIGDDLLRITTRKLISEPLGNLLGGTGGSGGLLGGLFGALGGAFGSFFGGSGYSLTPSTTGGITGSAGGIVDLSGGLLGGGRAIGGRVAAGSMHEVAERRPEVLDVNGRKFLLSKKAGTINPAPELNQRRTNIVNAPITVNLPANTSEQTANQAGAAVARRVLSLNRRFN